MRFQFLMSRPRQKEGTRREIQGGRRKSSFQTIRNHVFPEVNFARDRQPQPRRSRVRQNAGEGAKNGAHSGECGYVGALRILSVARVTCYAGFILL
jgi:hypothetical protein